MKSRFIWPFHNYKKCCTKNFIEQEESDYNACYLNELNMLAVVDPNTDINQIIMN